MHFQEYEKRIGPSRHEIVSKLFRLIAYSETSKMLGFTKAAMLSHLIPSRDEKEKHSDEKSAKRKIALKQNSTNVIATHFV